MSETVHESLTMLLYGPSKSGKTTLAATAPKPLLLLDVEGGARFLGGKKIVWDPMKDDPPSNEDGNLEIVIVHVNSYDTVQRAYAWILSGHHPFQSLVLDSVSELQALVLKDVAGTEQLRTQDWGAVLRTLSGFARDLRDVTMHPTNPLKAVILTAMSRADQAGKEQPFLSGQVANILPYLYDICGYLTVEQFPNPDPGLPSFSARRLYISGTNKAVCGERVGGRLPNIIEQDDLNFVKMIDKVYPKKDNVSALDKKEPRDTT